MGKIIALDSMMFIYLFEADPRYINYLETLFRQIESGEIKAFTSVISVIETLSPAKYLHDSRTATEITHFFQETPGLTVLPISLEIGLESARLRREFPHLRTPDAIQIATALIQRADTFLTNDAKLSKLVLPDLQIHTV